MISPEKPTAVYRLMDADGRLLYVGMSNDWPSRFAAHYLEKPWIDEVHHIDITWYGTREQARSAELHAIECEHPRYNIAGRSRDINGPPPKSAAVQFHEIKSQLAGAEQIIAWFVYSEGKRRDEPRGVVPRTGAPAYDDAIAWLRARGALDFNYFGGDSAELRWAIGRAPWETVA